MKQVNTISIKCDAKDYLELSELKEFQGGLKIRDDEDVDKILKSIKRFGFSFPFFVWKRKNANNVLDGHGRLLALQKLDELGYIIPPLPVVYVSCKDEQSARELLLRLNSHYGKMTKESVLEFIGEFEIDTTELELPSGNINFNADEEKPDFLVDETDGDPEPKEPKLRVIKCPDCGRDIVIDDNFSVIDTE